MLKIMKNNYENMSIKVKIFIYLLGFCAILLVILWFFQIIFLDNFYEYIKGKEVRNTAAIVEKAIIDEENNFIELLKSIDYKDGIKTSIFNEVGSITPESYANVKGNTSSEVLSDILEKLKNQKSESEYIALYRETELAGGTIIKRISKPGRFPSMPSSQNQQEISFSKIFKDKDGMEYFILLTSRISPVDATVKTLSTQLGVVTCVMIFCSIALAYIISENVSKPIVSINDSAKILAAGNYDAVFDAKGYREIEELTDTMNYTSRELSKVEGLRKELIANVSHDLRTPLTLISGYAEAMRDLPDENNPENAQIIIEEAKRLTTLVSDVLDLSKYQSGEDVLNPKKYNLTESIKKVLLRLSELVKEDGYTVDFEYTKDVFVKADETKISQAFYNLITNAINYTGEDKKIFVKQVILNDGFVKIEIKDTGDGIAEEELSYIWERYYKSKNNHKRAVTGTGIGLSIVKNIISLHNGEYGVESKIGEGSCFWFSIKTESVKNKLEKKDEEKL